MAVPSYSDVSAGLASALFDLKDIDAELYILTGNCHVDDSRNECVRSFLETDCERLMFIDADMRFHPEAVRKILEFDEDIVGGTYPLKQKETTFPVLKLGEKKGELYEVDGLPTGFLSISRRVLTELYNKYPKFKGKADGTRIPLSLIFERTLEGGSRYGGDYTFCLRAKELGFKIYLYPDIDFGHFGEEVWQGNYKRFLRKQNQEGTGDYLEKLFKKEEQAEDLIGFYDEWANDWSATPEFLVTCVQASRNSKKILEMGAGMTTLAMAKANPEAEIHSFEHDPMWAKKMRHAFKEHNITNVTLHQLPLKKYFEYYWYDTADLPAQQYDLLVIDGPPRYLAERKGVFEQIPYFITKAIILMDDCDDPNQKQCLEDWADSPPVYLGEERTFAICR